MPVVDIKGVGKAQFPDGMSVDDIRSFLQNKYMQEAIGGRRDLLAPQPQTISPVNLTLSERLGQGVSDLLTNTGLISNPYDAQQIGGKISAIGDFLPIIGDATAGDEFGRAVAQGDNFGMAMAGLGVIPLVGDALKQTLRKAKSINLPSGKLGSDQYKLIKQSDPKAKAKANPDGGVNVTYLDEYQPKQLKGPLHEFDPDALELSEGTFKNTATYKGDKNDPISVTKENGNYIILDGHHRAKLAKEEGRNVKAIVIPIDDVKKMKDDNVHQAEMLKEWKTTGKYNPKTKDLLKNKYPDLKIGISENADNIILDKVIVPEQSKGTGTKFMNDLIKDADSKGKPIGLTPSADFGGNKARLTKFYKRFGFVPNKGKNKDFTISESMIRPVNG